MAIPQLVEKALNDEFKFANIYSDSGMSLKDSLIAINFSSTRSLTSGFWHINRRLLQAIEKL
jgi:hypothetical protein